MPLDEKRGSTYNAKVLEKELNQELQKKELEIRNKSQANANAYRNKSYEYEMQAVRVDGGPSNWRFGKVILGIFIPLGLIFLIIGFFNIYLLPVGIIIILLGIVGAIASAQGAKSKKARNKYYYETKKREFNSKANNEKQSYEQSVKKMSDELNALYIELYNSYYDELIQTANDKVDRFVDGGLIDGMINYFKDQFADEFHLQDNLVKPDFVNEFSIIVRVNPTAVEIEDVSSHKHSLLFYDFKEHGDNNLPDYATQLAIAIVVGKYLVAYLLLNYSENKDGVSNRFTYRYECSEYKEYADHETAIFNISCNSAKERTDWN